MSSPSSPGPSRRLARLGVMAVGIVVAAVMVGLGLWQMQVFEDRGDKVASERAAQPPVALVERIPVSGDVGDVYGRNVSVSGTYVPHQQVLVVDDTGTTRVLAALQLDDGRVVPVVRGTVTAAELPPVPAGWQSKEGVFLPSEAGAEHAVAPDQLGSVRLATLAQRWPQRLAPGFLTLSEAGARAEGLSPAAVALPKETGAFRNLGYALQWWVFAAFAIGMGWVIARSMRDRVDPVETTDWDSVRTR